MSLWPSWSPGVLAGMLAVLVDVERSRCPGCFPVALVSVVPSLFLGVLGGHPNLLRAFLVSWCPGARGGLPGALHPGPLKLKPGSLQLMPGPVHFKYAPLEHKSGSLNLKSGSMLAN